MTNMNPDHSPFSFPQVDAYVWEQVFSNRAPKLAIDLIKRLMIYEPNQRIDALEAMAHPFFDELRLPNAILPNGKPLPALFDFSPDEVALANKRGLLAKLSPKK
jgi:serine/threonine protein kinase